MDSGQVYLKVGFKKTKNFKDIPTSITKEKEFSFLFCDNYRLQNDTKY